MNIVSDAISAYAEAHTTPEGEILAQLNKLTSGKILLADMLSGHLQGKFLTFISSILRPTRILEVGTFTGYSAICLAKGLAATGKLTTIEYNSELEATIRAFIDQANMSSAIEVLIGDAMKLIPNLEGSFDLIFIDADKKNYLNYYKMLLPKLSSKGVIIVDNVIWQGKVADQSMMDKETVLIREFNEYVKNDESVFKVMLPIRDGLYFIQKYN
jgi:caffeoyl-CoA O-methyltransferase